MINLIERIRKLFFEKYPKKMKVYLTSDNPYFILKKITVDFGEVGKALSGLSLPTDRLSGVLTEKYKRYGLSGLGTFI